MPVIHWFRRDLRLTDNPALEWAADQGQPLLLVYIHSPEEDGSWAPGAASRWWLHESLQRLDRSLQDRGQGLILRQGKAAQVLDDLIQQTGASAVSWNRLYEPAPLERDRGIEAALRKQGLEVHVANAGLLIEPGEVATGQGQPYRVFTPFWKSVLQRLAQPRISPAAELPPPPRLDSEPLATLGLHPGHAWADKLAGHWAPGEDAALERLEQFSASGLARYAQARDRPDLDGTSALSPYLHFGEIGPRQVMAEAGPPEPGNRFLAELGWREFARHLLFHFPQSCDSALNPRYTGFPWRAGAEAREDLRAWQRGETGIDLVDAGMRQLWDTGWMHNRVRMICASLLTKNLGVHWLEGARWFWDTLVDADLASNSLGWQWVAGCGADAAPYFRIFNPDTQAEKFDPAGDYRRRWLSGPRPTPIVDLKTSRQQALDSYAKWRDNPDLV